MRSIKSIYILVIMLLIGFVGQSFAVNSDTCTKPDTKSDMVQMDHSMHDMDMSMMDFDSFQVKKDCCEGMDAMSCSMDSCLMSNCISLLYLSTDAYGYSSLQLSSKIELYTFFDSKSERHSLFRPPIIR